MNPRNETRRLHQAAQDALASGSTAAVLSAAALSWRSWVDEGSAVGGLNGPSQWLWGRRAARTPRASLKHTAVGYLIHHGTSLFWAVLYERLFGARRTKATTTQVIAQAAGTTAAAYVVDYYLTPPRLQPGFEKHVSPGSMVLVYASFAAGLALTTLLRRR